MNFILITFILLSSVFCTSSWQNTFGGNEQNSRSFTDKVPPNLKHPNWAKTFGFEGPYNESEFVGFGIGPHYVSYFYTYVTDSNDQWNCTLYIYVGKRDGGDSQIIILKDMFYRGHSIDIRGGIYISGYQIEPVYERPFLTKLDPNQGGRLVWKYRDFQFGNISNPFIGDNSNSVKVCIGSNLVSLDEDSGRVINIRPEPMCGGEDSFLWGNPLFLGSSPKTHWWYGADDNYCREIRPREFNIDFLVKSKNSETTYYGLTKGVKGNNGSIAIYTKFDYPQYDCYILKQSNIIWKSPVFLGNYTMISLDIFRGDDLILLSTVTNATTLSSLTTAIICNGTASVLWLGKFFQGATQDGYMYTIENDLVQKYTLLNGKKIKSDVKIPLPPEWKNQQFSKISYLIKGVASQTVYISLKGYPQSQKQPKYAAVSLLVG